jgi:hypothetical protein
MSAEDEIKAMGAVSAALENLENEGRARVLSWAMSHYGVASSPAKPMWAVVGKTGSEAGTVSAAIRGHETFADLFNAAHPTTEKDKALVAAYWVQVCEGMGSFQSQSLNDLLKDLGHGIGNITEALNQLKDDRPALVLQLKKSGSSRQARKTYKLTLEGSKRVDAMTRSEPLE